MPAMIDLARRTLLLSAVVFLLASCDHGSDAAASDARSGAMADAAARDGAIGMDAGFPLQDASRDASPISSDAAVSADADGLHVDASDPKLHELELDPHQLDPSTKDSLSLQYAQLDTRTASLGKLVVFLPGATNVPRDWRDHGRKLAEFGFHVLIPHYNNRWSSDDTCAGMSNACGDNTRWEALTGEDTSSAIVIARADSVEGRVITMLKYLRAHEPGGDWGYYLSDKDELLYGRTVIAGISHGAASAGMYAARRSFSRNVMHSSGAAGSASAAKLTPVSEWYGFAHREDPAYSGIIASWNSFGLPGQPTDIDGQAAPFMGSHRLTTDASTSYPHGSVCVHSSSPKDAAGKYLFEPAWRYLYGVAE
jgi:hypothetical protein